MELFGLIWPSFDLCGFGFDGFISKHYININMLTVFYLVLLLMVAMQLSDNKFYNSLLRFMSATLFEI